MLQSLRQWWRWRNSLGGRGERAAAIHLRRAGYRILACNLRTRMGEIDILAEDRERRFIVVVEVKTTTNESPPPEEHVNYAKRRKLSTLAAQLLRRRGMQRRAVRFDVVGIVWPEGENKPRRLTHHENAFESVW